MGKGEVKEDKAQGAMDFRRAEKYHMSQLDVLYTCGWPLILLSLLLLSGSASNFDLSALRAPDPDLPRRGSGFVDSLKSTLETSVKSPDTLDAEPPANYRPQRRGSARIDDLAKQFGGLTSPTDADATCGFWKEINLTSSELFDVVGTIWRRRNYLTSSELFDVVGTIWRRRNYLTSTELFDVVGLFEVLGFFDVAGLLWEKTRWGEMFWGRNNFWRW